MSKEKLRNLGVFAEVKITLHKNYVCLLFGSDRFMSNNKI